MALRLSLTILVHLIICVTYTYQQGPPALDCALVKCAAPECDNPKQGTCCKYCPKQCEYNYGTYNRGDRFPSTDGCNKCMCRKRGNVKCTKKKKCQQCEYNYGTYNRGDRFPSTDGCNKCMCRKRGKVKCTKKYCPKQCEYNGLTYKSGDGFHSTDRCNDCHCDDGVVACMERYCSTCLYNGATYNSGDSFPSTDGCNTCHCDNGQVPCTKKLCPIQPKCPELAKPALGICVEGCSEDSDCEGGQRCCSNGCGHVCTIVGAPINPCATVKCGLPENCTRYHTPPEQCCPVCDTEPCKYNGFTYDSGESFPSTDGCNECHCNDGIVACTERYCSKCARDQYDYIQAGLIGRIFYCDLNGNYASVGCMGPVCYCQDMDGNQIGTYTVPIGTQDDLYC